MLEIDKRGAVRNSAASRDKRAPRKPVAVASPQERVDYAALRQRIMSRFAKTLAYLAK
jgi:hypothetical protein